MYFSGFADEASPGIDGQIRATKELGWTCIEVRNIDGVNIHDLGNGEFDIVYGKLTDAEISVDCFGSAIANWGKQVTDPFDSSLEEARRAIPRMIRLGTKLIRIMSFAVLDGRELDDQLEEERFRRLRELQKMFADAGMTVVHENCMNYGGMGWPYTLRLIENVPGLKLVFDTGNPVFNLDRSRSKPYPMQSTWEFYSNVKQYIARVHIKDAVWDAGTGNATYTYPGEGDGDVRRIVKDLLDNRYEGGFSIEPHLAVVFHDTSVRSDKEVMHANYVEYGRHLARLIDEVRAEASAPLC